MYTDTIDQALTKFTTSHEGRICEHVNIGIIQLLDNIDLWGKVKGRINSA